MRCCKLPCAFAQPVLYGAVRRFSSILDGTLNPMTHLIFGANTDVGKTVVSTGLIKACQAMGGAHYVKPLQCGGSDENFVARHAPEVISTTTLFQWETPTSPHTAARLEQHPVDDALVLSALGDCVEKLKKDPAEYPIWVETAGGVLSPSSSSPDNKEPHHASNKAGWGWIPQGDLYREFQSDTNVVMIGDGRLGGISASLASLEALLSRGYNVVGIILLEAGYANQTAIREYAARSQSPPFDSRAAIFDNPDASIISLPKLPPEPEPLTEWYESAQVSETLQLFVGDHLKEVWHKG